MPELVAVVVPGGQEFVETVLRVWERGDAVLPLDPDAPAPYLSDLLERLAPTRVATAPGEETRRPGVPVEEGDALVIATSGTTGRPRGVVLTHDAVEHAAYASASASGSTPASRWLACLPLSHVGGFSVVSRALATGAELEVHPRVDAAAVDDAARRGATHVSLVPTVLPRIDPAPWERILLGGAAVPVDRPANTVATYGMTETAGGVVYDGLCLPGVSLRVVVAAADGAGSARDALPDEVGAIELRSPTLLRCYRELGPGDDVGRARYGRRASPRGEWDPVGADGWFRTGDIGRVDADGRLHVEGRADEVIVTGGEKVWPAVVEAVLANDHRIAQVAVVGVDDPEWGQRVVAAVVPADPSDPPTLGPLRDLVRTRLPRWAAPKELRLVDSLPRTALGKIRRGELPVNPPEADAHG